MLLRNKMRVRTRVDKESVKCSLDLSPAIEGEFKFYCPVCLRYFNHILKSDCCGNYLCRFCVGDMARKARVCKDYTIRCAHC